MKAVLYSGGARSLPRRHRRHRRASSDRHGGWNALLTPRPLDLPGCRVCSVHLDTQTCLIRVRQQSKSEDSVGWMDQADRFWASELGVAPRVLRSEGFHVFERPDAAAQPRAPIVGTSSATVVSLPAGLVHAFENAGLSLKQMERAPRRYVASCVSNSSLEVRGPAYLAYWPTSFSRPSLRGQAELLAGDGLTSLGGLRDVAPAE